MRLSKLFTKVQREAPKDETSKNAQLLIKAGFIHKEMAGVYSYLPLGLRVLNKINDIIREEMNAIGGQEMKMTALQNKELWEKSNRWSDEVVDNWFKTNLKGGGELGLGFTHEEPIAQIMSEHVSSYKDLPFYAYQIQTKFRNESRAKAGLLRGREFLMKDLYSFSKNKEEHDAFYEKMKDVYMKVFDRLGMGDKTYLTISSGEPFSKYSYEFQTLADAGEDIIYIDKEKNIAINKADYNDEVVADFGLDLDEKNLAEETAIEIGDIYSLGDKYSKAMGLTYKNEKGEEEYVYMGSYGMSPSRLLGTLVEMNCDERGIIWPENVAPFKVILIEIESKDEKVHKTSEKIYQDLQSQGIEVVYDDRAEKSAGEKFAEADLIGIPWRVIISEKTLKEDKVEIKKRDSEEAKLIEQKELLQALE
ncbi:proline--tRNA ligase [Patescibacteria group bacterium]